MEADNGTYDDGWDDGAEQLAYDLLEFIEADPIHQDPANVRAYLESWLGAKLTEAP